MQLRFEQMIPVPRAAVFAVHEDPANLGRLMASFFEFRQRELERLARESCMGGTAPGCPPLRPGRDRASPSV